MIEILIVIACVAVVSVALDIFWRQVYLPRCPQCGYATGMKMKVESGFLAIYLGGTIPFFILRMLVRIALVVVTFWILFFLFGNNLFLATGIALGVSLFTHFYTYATLTMTYHCPYCHFTANIDLCDVKNFR